MNEITVECESGNSVSVDLRDTAATLLDALSEWIGFFDPKQATLQHSMAVLKVFASPGLKRSDLGFFLEGKAPISRSTAERLISASMSKEETEISDTDSPADDSGSTVDDETKLFVAKRSPDGSGLAIYLAPNVETHCRALLERYAIFRP